ncbi:MAG: response regulator [Phenylobacterium sp.]|uniref:ATP-binding protein n=1 Tax=Phenylobacterium sp. TaxID=1871053 RepID=UPI0011F6DFE8|nr:ATP-binding protein [Phenylobacterium sp.]TAL28929.1 MAG: response regulator [Phenylobacterium sp.]
MRRWLASREWRFSGGVLGLAIAAALIVFGACGVLVYYASVSVDRITEVRETRLMERSVVRRLARLKDDVVSVAVWTEAYDKTARRFDRDFAQVNYADYFFDYLRHDVTFIVDAQDRLTYGAVKGEVVDPRTLDGLMAASQTLRDVVRSEEAVRHRRDPKARGFARAATAQAAVRTGERVYLLAASTIVPEVEDAKPLLPGREPIVVSGVEVNGGYLRELDDDLGLRAARLTAADATARPAVRLTDAERRAVGALTWSPEHPGQGVYAEARWAILGLGLVVLAAVALVIHRLWRMARQVVQARDRAEAGDRAKSEFIANISHEIRTPLNGVLGMAQAMEAFELSPDQRGRLRVIRESGRTLLALLNDVLDLSKLEAGKLQATAATFRMEDNLESVSAIFQDLATEKGLDLRISMAPEVAGYWSGDDLRIRQVLTNLISNAVKFTETGVVTLSAEETGGGVRFQVSDTGIGIDPASASDLFRKFEQADASTTRRYGGTGLGLSICQGLVELMGGTISATGQPGQGACFTVDLPLSRATAPVASPEPAVEAGRRPGRPLRILAAEDNVTNRMVLKALIDPLGADLTLAANGREAIEAFVEARFDVVLMDVQMPEMNGLDATREIRRLEAEWARTPTPILALTANVMSHQLEQYLAVGMDGHIAKPLDVGALYAALDDALAGAQEERAV